MAKKSQSIELRVGLFVVGAMVLFAVLILLLGSERNIFDRQVHLATQFDNVQGLKLGAAVRLSGVVIGSVTKISFGE